jgi:4a-hydroxytetrahydrobiopterin dehydratase
MPPAAIDLPTLSGLATAPCQPNPPCLSTEDIARCLAVLPGWARNGDRIEKTFRFADYPTTIAFVDAVARLAEDCRHHPDLSVHYGRCVVSLTTHDSGGISLNDAILAAGIERLAT